MNTTAPANSNTTTNWSQSADLNMAVHTYVCDIAVYMYVCDRGGGGAVFKSVQHAPCALMISIAGHQSEQ
eukprot:9503657-Pyramimonas_sp.AAC.1